MNKISGWRRRSPPNSRPSTSSKVHKTPAFAVFCPIAVQRRPTTVAEIVGKVFQNVIYVPYCVDIDGEIMKVFDPAIHRRVDEGQEKEGAANLRRSRVDQRWVPCYRPMVITGGELTLEMLDLKFNPIAKYYEAPLHMKANGGTFLIDDFGRQHVEPTELLNRWIIPLENRIDYFLRLVCKQRSRKSAFSVAL